ncbi:MAG: aldehyde dehydrogenase [Bacteroidales bacterium]|jgi:aldehyde dehydrogenase (NAD+)|nr:aldehyde dehydrogenase [Bacteroidales bacterium]MDD4385490.1 aldehyde dehydrogenase [Bacteroidales bacterium]MDY0198278.1 aldehyde dehydrogenase [Tenuifilaceae bacterium]
MDDTTQTTIDNMLEAQREFFASHQTKDIKFRLEQLKKFKSAIHKYERKIADALWTDLHKSFEEAYLTEISIVYQEIDNHIKNLKKWAKPKRVPTPIHLLPSKGRIIFEPLGVALIVAPWNYPFQLLMNPLVGSISAGNCAILKPSPYTANTARVMEEMIKETFSPNYIGVVQGGRNTNELLFSKQFDIIFFTGSPVLGRVVMKAAAEHLTPVVLELGGKSPCIVDKDANLAIAAKRIAWGKTINAGQTCIAPDYVLAHKSIKEELIRKIAESIEEMFGKDIKSSKFYPRIVNHQAHDRLVSYLKDGTVKFGGEHDKSDRFISPTILDDVLPEHSVMHDEIFGPILPILSFNETEDALKFINSREKPLAFYYFGKSKNAKEILYKSTSGGACINDTLMHITNHHLPFGGVGNSGLGKYHGKTSFLALSNQRSTVLTPTWIDLPLKYVPFKYFKLIRRII